MKQVRYSESWERRRLKFIADVKTSNVDKHILDDEIPVRLCNYTDVYYNRVIKDDMELSAGSVTQHELNRFGLRRGQVLMTKDSESWDDIAVPAYVSQDMPEVVCGYHLAMVEPLGDELDGEFFCWAAQTDTINDHYKLEARGVTRFGLGHYALKNVEIGFPSQDRQRAINAFLRKKTAAIDDLIAKKQGLLGLLVEKRSALITRAVTKGLDPTAPTKPSGIDWLGDIPAQWEARRLRFIGRAQNGINIGGEFFGKGYPFVSYSDVFRNFELPQEVTGLVESSDADRNRYAVRRGDIFFTRTSETIEEIGMSSVCLKTIPSATFAGFLIRVRPYPNVLIPEFSKFYFRNTSLRAFLVKEMNLVTRASLSQTLLGNIPVLIPPRKDQERIVAYINENLATLNDVASNIEGAIERLTEYRAAIITKAVTGELEVT